MITKVNNSKDMRDALNENLHGLLTGKRKPSVVKDTNVTLGRFLSDVKMEMKNNQDAGIKGGVSWFANGNSKNSKRK